jgi:hypothetical protein
VVEVGDLRGTGDDLAEQAFDLVGRHEPAGKNELAVLPAELEPLRKEEIAALAMQRESPGAARSTASRAS